MGQDQKGKNKVKETDGKGMGRDYKREERAKKTGERQKSQQNGRDYKRKERREREGIIGTQNLRPEKILKLIGGVMIKGTKGARQMLSAKRMG